MGWHVKPLGEVVTLQRGFDLPKQDRQPGSVPIVSSSGVSGTHNEARVSAPGVVTGRYGSIGQVHFIETDFWPLNTTLFVKDFKGNDPRFVAYLLRTIDFASCSDKSSVPGVNRNDLHRLRVAVPDLPEQRFIAETLGALDDKIDLNRRMNRTLESIARAIFKSWFVDFDPVRRKMEGGEVGLPPDLAAIFPERLEESPVGRIPQGWEYSQLGELVHVVKGRSYKGSELAPSDTALVTLKSFKRDGGYREDGLKDYTGPFKAQQLVESGDVLVAHTDVTQAAEVLGRAVRVRESERYSRLVASLDTAIVRPARENLSREFLFFALDTRRFRDHAYGYCNGTTVLHLSVRALPEYPVVVPPPGLVAAFTSIAEVLLGRADLLALETVTLVATRDRLLPQLMPSRTAVPGSSAAFAGAASDR